MDPPVQRLPVTDYFQPDPPSQGFYFDKKRRQLSAFSGLG